MLTPAELDAFVEDGYAVVRGAFAESVATQCRDEIWQRLAEQGVVESEPSTWVHPEMRVPCPEGDAFASAGTSPLLWEAYDQLIGPGRWPKRAGVGGSVVVRFPSEESIHVGGDGWHIESWFPSGDRWWSNVHSPTRALLTLVLLSDVGPDDAPPALLAGSHLDAARVLGATDGGMDWWDVRSALPEETFARRQVFATGSAGDVYVVHPFLVHRSTWPHRGSNVRFIVQPSIYLDSQYELKDRANALPVERSIFEALGESFA